MILMLIVERLGIVCKGRKLKWWGFQILVNRENVYTEDKAIQDSYRLRTRSIFYLPVSSTLGLYLCSELKRGRRGGNCCLWAFCWAISFHQDLCHFTSLEDGRHRKIVPLILFIDPGAKTIPS